LAPRGSDAVALLVPGIRAVLRAVRFPGAQDTLYARSESCASEQGTCVPAHRRISCTVREAFHQGSPWPTRVPRPAIVTFSKTTLVKRGAHPMRSMPSHRPSNEGTLAKSVVKNSVAPVIISTSISLPRKIGPVRYLPGGQSPCPRRPARKHQPRLRARCFSIASGPELNNAEEQSRMFSWPDGRL
jgi:hypothetical protein